MSNEQMLPAEAQTQAPATTGDLMGIEEARAIQEVQASLIMARRFPRDEIKARNRILEDCKRVQLAEQATYAYPRRKTTITGPSIRLAEVMARHWGNLDYGMRELARRVGVSTMEAYCWDYETNVKTRRTFDVPHIRWTKHGPVTLKDPRDVYEMAANMGSRRVRACILQIIPGHIVDEAVKACEATLVGVAGGEPIVDRATRMVKSFAELGVPQVAIEEMLGHGLDAIIETELVRLRQIYQSIKDGMSKREDWFDLTEAKTTAAAEDLKARLQGAQKSAAPTPPEDDQGPNAMESSPPSAPPQTKPSGGEGATKPPPKKKAWEEMISIAKAKHGGSSSEAWADLKGLYKVTSIKSMSLKDIQNVIKLLKQATSN